MQLRASPDNFIATAIVPCPPFEEEKKFPSGWIGLSGALMVGYGRSHMRHWQRKKARRKLRALAKYLYVSGHVLCLLGVLTMLIAALAYTDSLVMEAHAEDTVADYRMYNGTLRNAQGAAITTAHRIRFSYWRTSDAVPSDLTASGTINPAAAGFLGWTEVHTVTPNAQGNFFVKLGSIQQISLFEKISADDARNLHMQVEVKSLDAPLTSFEILDIKPSDPLIDRTPVLPVPTARNADLLDLRDTGTGSGEIAVLQTGGLLPVSTIPGGTNSGSFVIDANNTETQEINLKFGTTLMKELSYDIANSRFNFNDDVRIEGDLTVTGLINGVDISDLADAPNTHLKVSSGAGLTVSIAAGSYRLNGTLISFAGGVGNAVPNNATSHAFFGSGGLTIRIPAFPTDESFIPLASITTSGGTILNIVDKRVLQNDDRENTVLKTFNAMFEHASFQGDGADNVGQLINSHDGINLRNYYNWSSTRTSLQDYDIIQRITLPAGFVRWDNAGADNPVQVLYRSTSADVLNNKLDVQFYDTNGTPVTMSGAATGLASTSWATRNLEFTGNPTWTAGQDILIRYKLSAKDDFQMHLAEVKLRFVELLGDH